MHPADIKAAIEKAGSSQAAIARAVKHEDGRPVSPGAVYLVIKGLSKSRRIAMAVRDATGIPVARLWPGRYPDLEINEPAATTHRRKT